MGVNRTTEWHPSSTSAGRELLVLSLVDGEGPRTAVTALVRTWSGKYTACTWDFPKGRLAAHHIDEISSGVDQLVQDVLLGVLGKQELLGEG